ncbi:MAG TPA: RpiB/LacA/LacB family sugar-phosphate isomerase [Euzebyales bacterium]
MRISFGADDTSPTVVAVLDHLRAGGHDVRVVAADCGWPTMAREIGTAVADGSADVGIVLCWTGTGTSIAANKVPGVRAALAWEPWIAHNARRWNDANVLAMSLKRTAPDVAVEIVDAFLAVSDPDDDELENIAAMEPDTR